MTSWQRAAHITASQDRRSWSAGHPTVGHVSRLPFKFMLGGRENQRAGVQSCWGSKVIIWRVAGTSSTQDPGTTWERERGKLPCIVTSNMFLIMDQITRRRRDESLKRFSPLSCEGAAGLDVPLVVFDGGELQTLGDLSHRHATLHVLLVCKNQ